VCTSRPCTASPSYWLLQRPLSRRWPWTTCPDFATRRSVHRAYRDAGLRPRPHVCACPRVPSNTPPPPSFDVLTPHQEPAHAPPSVPRVPLGFISCLPPPLPPTTTTTTTTHPNPRQARHSPDPADQTIWSFMRVQFNASKRHGLLAHLGYDSESIASSVASYVASVSSGTGAPSEVPAPVAAARSPVAAPAESVLMPTGGPGDAASLFGGAPDVTTSAADFFGAPPVEPTPAAGAGAPTVSSPVQSATKPGPTPPPLDPAAAAASARATEEARKSEPTPVCGAKAPVLQMSSVPPAS
jgi:hypothetical protein